MAWLKHWAGMTAARCVKDHLACNKLRPLEPSHSCPYTKEIKSNKVKQVSIYKSISTIVEKISGIPCLQNFLFESVASLTRLLCYGYGDFLDKFPSPFSKHCASAVFVKAVAAIGWHTAASAAEPGGTN